jgi:hypothetical protein
MQSLSDPRACAHPLLPVTCHAYSVTCDDNSTETCLNDNYASKATKREGDGKPCAAEPPSGGAAGLVYSQTSGTRNPDYIRVDRQANRLKRLRSSVITAARLHEGQTRKKWKCAMLTLTYRDARGWRPEQISDLVRHIRQWLKRKGIAIRYVWVQEFCKKDARPHYHMLVWLPFGLSLPKPDKRGWWLEGWTKIEWARNAVGYIAKYASKGDSLSQPAKGARMHGSGGLTDEALLEQRWWKLPTWLRSDVEPSDRVRRAAPHSGGGFVSPGTGEVYRSPWIVFFKGGQVYIQRRVVQ